jgi:hypothetical protein
MYQGGLLTPPGRDLYNGALPIGCGGGVEIADDGSRLAKVSVTY